MQNQPETTVSDAVSEILTQQNGGQTVGEPAPAPAPPVTPENRDDAAPAAAVSDMGVVADTSTDFSARAEPLPTDDVVKVESTSHRPGTGDYMRDSELRNRIREDGDNADNSEDSDEAPVVKNDEGNLAEDAAEARQRYEAHGDAQPSISDGNENSEPQPVDRPATEVMAADPSEISEPSDLPNTAGDELRDRISERRFNPESPVDANDFSARVQERLPEGYVPNSGEEPAVPQLAGMTPGLTDKEFADGLVDHPDLSRADGRGHGVGGMTMDEIGDQPVPDAMDPEKIKQFQAAEESEDDEVIQADPREIQFMLSHYMTRVETLTHKNVHLMARIDFYDAYYAAKGEKLDKSEVDDEQDQRTPGQYRKALANAQHRNIALASRVKFFEQYINSQTQIIDQMSDKLRELGFDPKHILAAYFAPEHDGGAESDSPATVV